MKNLFYFVVLVLMLTSCSTQPIELNVMTFNIRYDNPGDSLNSWQYRKDIATDVIKNHKVDLLGTQEVLIHQLNDMKVRLPEYAAVGVGREDGKEKGEHSAIFYKKDRFNLLQSGTFWLSETPESAGSKGWDGACERVATWVILEEAATKKQLFFINTHLDHVGKIARNEGVSLLLKKAEALAKGLPIIISGDFNSAPGSDVVRHLTETKHIYDSKARAASISDRPYTYAGFGKEQEEYIDYIFVNEKVDVLRYEVLSDKVNGAYISDHTPVLIHVKIQ